MPASPGASLLQQIRQILGEIFPRLKPEERGLTLAVAGIDDSAPPRSIKSWRVSRFGFILEQTMRSAVRPWASEALTFAP